MIHIEDRLNDKNCITLHAINGCGTFWYGLEPDIDSSVSGTKWVVLFYFPFIPIYRRKFRLGYLTILSKLPLDLSILKTYIKTYLLFLPAVIIPVFLFTKLAGYTPKSDFKSYVIIPFCIISWLWAFALPIRTVLTARDRTLQSLGLGITHKKFCKKTESAELYFKGFDKDRMKEKAELLVSEQVTRRENDDSPVISGEVDGWHKMLIPAKLPSLELHKFVLGILEQSPGANNKEIVLSVKTANCSYYLSPVFNDPYLETLKGSVFYNGGKQANFGINTAFDRVILETTKTTTEPKIPTLYDCLGSKNVPNTLIIS